MNRMLPRTILPGRGTSWRIDRAVTVLPDPLSPTIPSTLSRWSCQGHAVDSLHHAVLRVEVGMKVLHLYQG